MFPVALHPLVKQLEDDAYSNPSRAIEVARQLLKHSHSPEQLAYVYEHLGFTHLILGEHRLSCLFYEQARTFQPQGTYILANLAHAQYELGQRDKAVETGREALMLKDQIACQTAECLVEPLQAPHHGPLNLISFSLYGQSSRYCEMAVLNVLAAQRHLPDFVCRFYLDDSVPTALVRRLRSLGAQCVFMGNQVTRMPATFWRFLAMDDEQADCVLVRDVDALVDARDAWCVQNWRQSEYPFHIIRDDCCHTELILAGLLGIRAGVLRGIQTRIEQYLHESGPAGWKRYADQLFLRNKIWPSVRRHAWTHDQIYGYGQMGERAPDRLDKQMTGPLNAFIGANHATARVTCRFDQPIPPGVVPLLTIRNGAGLVVCCHALQAVTGGALAPSPSPAASEWEIHLPRLYESPLHSGGWTCHPGVSAEAQAHVGEGSVDPVLLGVNPACTDSDGAERTGSPDGNGTEHAG